MKIEKLIEIINNVERNNNLIYELYEALGAYDDEAELYKRWSLEKHSIYDCSNAHPRDVYNKKEIEMLDAWAQLFKEDNFSYSPFCERTFLRTFLKDIPKEKQMSYIKNTNMYYGSNKNLADPNYVLVTRRALPTISAKPEAFWSDNPTTTFWGLRNELQTLERTYSTILVSTLGLLQEHGEQDFEDISGGVSDGEIRTSCKPFPREKILFTYKPISEVYQFVEAIKENPSSFGKLINEKLTKMATRYSKQQPNSTTTAHPEQHVEDFNFDEWD